MANNANTRYWYTLRYVHSALTVYTRGHDLELTDFQVQKNARLTLSVTPIFLKLVNVTFCVCKLKLEKQNDN